MNGTTTTVNNPCDCSDATGSATLAPNKRVDYAFGMVLGVDDFRQEQFHAEWKSKISNLLLHGYGTVCGLRIWTEPASDGDVELHIEPGFGISPKGEWIWVEKAQCAKLGRWVKGSMNGLTPPFAAGPQTVFVRLCYTECETDLVPIAGGPCAAADQTRAPSRITESFQAAFSWQPPAQALEDDIRAMGQLLHRVELVDGPVTPPQDNALIAAVRALAPPPVPPSPPAPPSPPVPPPPSPPSPPSPPDNSPIKLDRLTACDTIRQAIALWTTEVRPAIGGGKCLPGPDTDDCILLAALHFSADANGVIQGDVQIDQTERPILAPTRLIQELLPCGCCGDGNTSAPQTPGGDLAGTVANATVIGLQTRPMSANAPAAGDVLTFVPGANGAPGQWTPAQPAVVPPPAPAGNFVQANHGPYAIVAAGFFQVTQPLTTGIPTVTPLAVPYNNLKVRAAGAGIFQFVFDGYSLPTKEFTYIVKGTPQTSKPNSPPYVFNFISFTADFITVEMLPTNADTAPLAGFMVEISAYGKMPPNP